MWTNPVPSKLGNDICPSSRHELSKATRACAADCIRVEQAFLIKLSLPVQPIGIVRPVFANGCMYLVIVLVGEKDASL